MSDTKDVVIDRTFAAPLILIWQMWTDPDHFKAWYGPQGVTVSVAEMDVQVGGKRVVCMEMQSPNGAVKMWFGGEYLTVDPTTQLVYTDSVTDEDGTPVSPASMGMPGDHPMVTEVSVLLEDLDWGTKMVMTHAGVPAGSPGEAGWNAAFANLESYVTNL